MSDVSSISLTGIDTTTNASQDEDNNLCEAFKNQLFKLQGLMEEYNTKIINKTLCSQDLTDMHNEMLLLVEVENKVTPNKMKFNYVTYKVMSLKLVQESYRICNWLLEKECNKMDNLFNIDSYIDKLVETCADKENPLEHLDTLFNDCILNTHSLNLNFYANISSEASLEQSVSTQLRREYRKSQKRPLEDVVVPDEVDNEAEDNELDITLRKVLGCLKEAIKNNQEKPIHFYKFAIDPFSLTYTIENLFYLALLLKDNAIIIDRVSGNESNDFTYISIANKKSKISKYPASTLFKINQSLWLHFIRKYNITERMIKQ